MLCGTFVKKMKYRWDGNFPDYSRDPDTRNVQKPYIVGSLGVVQLGGLVPDL